MNQWISDMNDGVIIFSWFSFRVPSHCHGWLKRTEQFVMSSTCSGVSVVMQFICCCAVEAPEWKKSYIYTWSWDCNLPQTDTCIVLVFHMRFVWLRFDVYLDSWYLHNVDLNAQFTFFCLFWHLLGSWMETLLSSQKCWRTLKWERPIGRYTFTTLCSLSSFIVLFQCPHSDSDFLRALNGA